MSELKKILLDNGFVFKKQLGQNFISDINLLNSVVADSGITSDCTVIEIGAGAGSLTRALAGVAKRVITYEIDSRLMPILAETLSDYKNIEIKNCDIMKVSNEEIKELTQGKFKVVANLPYYITTPIIMRFIESDLDVTSITVMIQKEVAERLTAKYDTEEYGAITVAVKIVADVTITRMVNRKLFFPMPNVDSAVIRIDINRNKYDILDMSTTKKLIKCAFAMRRKTLVNNIMAAFQVDREKANGLVVAAGLDEKIRGEALSVEDFVNLGRIIGGK